MTRRLTVAGLLVMALFLTGCKDSHDKVTRDMIGVMKEMNTVLEDVKDEASAKAAAPKMEKIGAKMEAIQKRMKEVGDPSPEVEKALKEKYEKDMKEVLGPFMKNLMRIGMDPKLSKPMEDAMKKLKDLDLN